MNILLTGSNGFIGKNIISYFGNFHNIVECSRSSKYDITNLETLINIENIDVVIHAAAKTDVSESFVNPYDFYNFNITTSINLAEYCRIKEIKKIIYLNTYLYGTNPSNPINEEHVVSPTSPYSKSKYFCENLFINYFEYPISVISLRISNLFGKNQSKNFFIPNLVNQVLNNEIPIINDIRPKRDYLYIKDLLNLLDFIISDENSSVSGVFNIGSGKSYSCLEVIKKLEILLNKEIKFVNKNIFRKNEILDCFSDSSKIRKVYGWKCNYSFEEGLKDYLQEIKN